MMQVRAIAAFQGAEVLPGHELHGAKLLDFAPMNSSRSENNYRPIPCANYDTYEIAIMHRQRLHLVWDEDNVVYDQFVTPLNLRTSDGAEYLILRTISGDTREVRLDRIRRAQPA